MTYNRTEDQKPLLRSVMTTPPEIRALIADYVGCKNDVRELVAAFYAGSFEDASPSHGAGYRWKVAREMCEMAYRKGLREVQ